ncbi:LOB domain-containing protein [Heracleum sosnowskyi]|uniref:LOB domain-containing protein n=1 Tax=Heracleum sosnowskyi TaxID=360622 RepID=A0AAD8HZD7_9APIA|nr:LOB domain-containing protein [Heracleum sosnowskyi]
MMVVRAEGSGGPCGACRFLRRKCVEGCIFAPYFVSDHLGTSHLAAVHKVFGASNASKILFNIPPHKRPDAVVSLCYEALSRVSDPVYGCVSHIFNLQQQVDNLQAELAYTFKLAKLAHSQQEQTSFELDIRDPQEDKDDDLQRLARELVAKYFPGLQFSFSD